MAEQLTLAEWYAAQRHKRGPRPERAQPRFIGNATGKPDSVRKPGSPLNRIHNLQHTITREEKLARAAAQLGAP